MYCIYGCFEMVVIGIVTLRSRYFYDLAIWEKNHPTTKLRADFLDGRVKASSFSTQLSSCLIFLRLFKFLNLFYITQSFVWSLRWRFFDKIVQGFTR